MRLVIVNRDRPEVYERLANRFAREVNVRVIFDRRARLPESPPSTERRHDEAEALADLSDRGYIVVDMP